VRCTHCGEKIKGLHVCSPVGVTCEAPAGGPSAEPLYTSEAVGFNPVHYFRQALAIVWFDGEAIKKAGRDSGALVHGMLFLVVGIFLNALVADLIETGGEAPALTVSWWVDLILGAAIVIIALLLYYGVFYFVVRRLFDARGTYWGLVRPLFLSSILTWVGGIPIIGLIPEMWLVAVFIVICEEAAEIERWEAIVGSLIAAVPFVALVLLFVSRIPV
jgi:hypothetical protein